MVTLKDAQAAKPVAVAIGRQAEIPALTGLRFLAALSVAVAHGAAITIQFKDPSPEAASVKLWLQNGAGFGMTLFFVLSGFVIHFNYSDIIASQGARGFAQFMWARFSRLYPLFLVVLVVDIVLGARLFDAVGSSPTGAIVATLAALPYYLTLTQSWLYTVIDNNSLIYQIGNAAPPMWSISTEWFFYVCYPIIMLILVRATRPGYAIAGAVAWSLAWGGFAYCLAGRAVDIEAWAVSEFGAIAAMTTAQGGGNQDSFVRWLLYFSPYLRIGEFILGCSIAQIHMSLRDVKIRPWESVFAPAALWLSIISIPVILFLMYEPGGTHWIRLLSFNFGLAPSIGLLLFCAARYRTRALRLFESRALQRLGDASYSVYLIHLTIFIVFMRGLETPVPSGATGTLYLFARFAIMLGFLFVLSLAVFTYVEDPARRVLRRLWAQPGRVFRPSTIALAPALCAVGLVATGYLLKSQEARRIEATSGIIVTSATYGENCGARPGNATGKAGATCNGETDCTYVVDVALLGDPAGGCAKDFSIDYICAPNKAPRRVALPAEAGLKSRARLQCHAGIMINSATYGRNCGVPAGNATDRLRATCDGQSECSYVVDVSELGDPAPGCGKDFTVEFTCGADDTSRRLVLPGEAGLKSVAQLQCATGQVAR